MKRDVQATANRRFKDPRSYVTPAGDEVLYEEDWNERKFELLQRSRGQCENIINGRRCTRDCADPHHVTKRSVRRDDRMSNLKALCPGCHRKQHPEKEPMWTRRGAVRDEGVST